MRARSELRSYASGTPIGFGATATPNSNFATNRPCNFPTYSEDTSLQKNFVPHEGLRVQFRAEFLNLLNRHNFTGINTDPASPLFGQISGVSDNPRKIQFGIRADF